MASSRNIKGAPPSSPIIQQHEPPPFETVDNVQSNTLKRHPKMDLNKSDLLKLLSYLEGELQARDIVIATLKAEKAKQLLYQAKYGRFGLGDPFMGLQRDSDNMKDSSFDESQIKLMYDNQLAQLENLIATQRRAQSKMREQLSWAEKRYHKSTSELEDEKRKHAQDTAQGDDVTYMLEKERERLKQEVDFEKSQNKRLEKDLKKSLASLEEERANSKKHKQVALMLIKERKKLEDMLLMEKHKRNIAEQAVNSDKSRLFDMVDGLEEESKKSLLMEAVMERQLSEFDVEREQLRSKLGREETRSRELQGQVDQLTQQLETVQLQLAHQRASLCESPQSIEIKSSVVSPSKTKEGSREGSLTTSPAPDSWSSGDEHCSRKPVMPVKPTDKTLANNSQDYSSGVSDTMGERITPVGALNSEKIPVEHGATSPRTGASMSSGSTTVYTIPSGGKLSVHVGGGGVVNSPRKLTPAGRGTPPPVPPNKPVLTSPLPGIGAVKEGLVRAVNPGVGEGRKPVPPPKAGITLTKDRLAGTGQEGGKIPVSQVNVVSNQPGGVTSGRSQTRDSSPMRKTTQSNDLVDAGGAGWDQSSTSSGMSPTTNPESHLDFLGQEMADLQQVLVSMATGESSPYPVNVSSCSSVIPDIHASPIHKHSAAGNLTSLRNLISDLDNADLVNSPLTDGTTALHCAAETGQEDCLKLLLESGANPNLLREDLFSTLHSAAGHGHYGCLKLLIDYHGDIQQTDRSNWTPLHWAATHSHLHCCTLLLDSGAHIEPELSSATNWTPLHCAIHAGHVDTLRLLLTYHGHGLSPGTAPTSTLAHLPVHQGLLDTVDKDGWTLAHLAAICENEDCLQIILENCSVNLEKQDKWGRTALDVASAACRDFIQRIGTSANKAKVCFVSIATSMSLETGHVTLKEDQGSSSEVITVGTIHVDMDTAWSRLEELLDNLLNSYFSSLDTGLKTRKTARLDPDHTSLEGGQQTFTLGLSADSVKDYSIGLYTWKPGSLHNIPPFEIMSNNDAYQVIVNLYGGDGGQESVAYETLAPVTVVQNYLRLIEQYRNVVFYGPVGSGKSLLAHQLAHCVMLKEKESGKRSDLHQITCTETLTNQQLLNFLTHTGCIVPAESLTQEETLSTAPVIVLNELDKINIAQVFGDLLKALEHRGSYFTFKLHGSAVSEETFCFVENFYLIGTMDRTRSTGLELSIQQRLRWVHFRVDAEPTKHLLARQLWRRLVHVYGGRLPPSEDPVYRAVEWVVCVWQRLNDGLSKLGLPEVVFGPGIFFSCPIQLDQSERTLSWLSDVWNNTIAPVVTEAVVRGTGTEASVGGQQKVASTALYVLMQRAVVSGCPLTGTEKERYLSGFQGSNELEIPFRPRPHSISESTLSLGKPLSPTVQLKSVLGLSSPLIHAPHRGIDDKKIHSWLNSPIMPMFNDSRDDELRHKKPSSRLIANKSNSDTDLTASMPKVRRLEIRTPNLLSSSPLSAKGRSSSTSTISHDSSLPLRSSSPTSPLPTASSQSKSPPASVTKGNFNFSPTSASPTNANTALPSNFSFTSGSSSPTFTTKLPRAVAVFKTTLSSVNPGSYKMPSKKSRSSSGKNVHIFSTGNNNNTSTTGSGNGNYNGERSCSKSPKNHSSLSSPKNYNPDYHPHAPGSVGSVTLIPSPSISVRDTYNTHIPVSSKSLSSSGVQSKQQQPHSEKTHDETVHAPTEVRPGDILVSKPSSKSPNREITVTLPVEVEPGPVEMIGTYENAFPGLQLRHISGELSDSLNGNNPRVCSDSDILNINLEMENGISQTLPNGSSQNRCDSDINQPVEPRLIRNVHILEIGPSLTSIAIVSESSENVEMPKISDVQQDPEIVSVFEDISSDMDPYAANGGNHSKERKEQPQHYSDIPEIYIPVEKLERSTAVIKPQTSSSRCTEPDNDTWRENHYTSTTASTTISEMKSPMEALAKVLQGEERVSLC